jgi:peptidoglycan hydrolase-like protein with peptidoglycan-binding domain
MRNTLRRIGYGVLGAGMIVAMTAGASAGAASAASAAPAVTAAKPAALSWPTVKRGAAGERVYAIQYLLNYRTTARLHVDGKFGLATQAAVRSFQRKAHLSAEGVVGNTTWSRLIVTLTKGSRGDAVRAVQHNLRYAYGHKILSVDGIFGAKTLDAVKAFQKKYRLKADGIVGAATWNTLVRNEK